MNTCMYVHVGVCVRLCVYLRVYAYTYVPTCECMHIKAVSLSLSLSLSFAHAYIHSLTLTHTPSWMHDAQIIFGNMLVCTHTHEHSKRSQAHTNEWCKINNARSNRACMNTFRFTHTNGGRDRHEHTKAPHTCTSAGCNTEYRRHDLSLNTQISCPSSQHGACESNRWGVSFYY